MNYWHQLAEKINQRTLRERIILGLVVLAVVYFIVDLAIVSALQKEKNALNLRMAAAQQEFGKYLAQEKVLAKAITNDPNAAKKRELLSLQERLASIDKNLATLATGLIAAEKLPEVLHDVLNAKGKLTLLAMETAAPSRLRLQGPAVDDDTIESDEEKLARELDQLDEKNLQEPIGVFKHSVFVSMQGSYFDVVNYLSALEDLPWKFYWEAIDYRVEDYPSATVTIEVYTLSTEAGLLGV